MGSVQTAPAENRAQAWRVQQHRRDSYRVAGEVSPVAPVDRGGHRQRSGRHPGDGCSLGGALDRLAEGTAV